MVCECVFDNKIIGMLPLIDFRNGRYQGDIRNKMPHGVGIFFSVDLLFVVGHWQQGALSGKAIVIFPDATIFCGSIRDGSPEGACYYQLERENIKVYFHAQQKEQKLAIAIPNFNSILEVDRHTLDIKSECPIKKGDNRTNLTEASRIIELQLTSKQQDGRQYESFINYFQENFSIPYGDVFQQLIINVNGAIQYWMGFRQEGLGVKAKPLPFDESGGRSYRISEVGVMSRENVLFGVGVKTSNSVLGRVQVEEGIFALPHTLSSYRLSEGHNDKTRPSKCITAFVNFLKRSMAFVDAYLTLKEVIKIKEEINKIHELTFTEMKIKNAHQIIQNPIKNQQVMAEIQKNRRKKQEVSELFYQQRKMKNSIQPSIFNSNQIDPLDSSFNLKSMKDDLYRSISKRKNAQSRVNGEIQTNHPQYNSPSQLPQSNSSPSKKKPSNDKRLNGSITPTKKTRKPSQDKKAVGILVSKTISRQSPMKYPLYNDLVQEPQRQPQIDKRTPAPILKKVTPESSPSKRKISYIDKQMQEWEKAQIKFGRKDTSPKKYGSKPIQGNAKASSPGKQHSRRILTQNIFEA